MKLLPLTQGKFALVDNEDYEWLSQWKWQYKSPGYAARAVHRYTKKGRITQTRLMHREIMKPKRGFWVDHITHTKLDNRRENLRVCTPAQNNWNKRKGRGQHKYKGVVFDKKKPVNPWLALISANGTTVYLGCYASEDLAALAYNTASLRLHGEFGRLNMVG